MAEDRPELPLVLGSGSPRRRALMRGLGVDFVVQVADVDERPLWSADVAASAQRSAEAKLTAIAATIDGVRRVLTADTLVAVDGSVLGKPRDRADARSMLERASANRLSIVTAVTTAAAGSAPRTVVVESTVSIVLLTDRMIDDYLATGVALDKAGALELQGEAATFIDRLEGCWSNIVGLPICAVGELLDLAPAGRSQAERCSGSRCGADLLGAGDG